MKGLGMMTSRTPSTYVKAIIVACILAVCGCATPPPAAVVDADPSILRVGVSPDAAPLIYKKDAQITGLEADMAKDLATYLQRSPVFVELPWEDQIPALLDDRIDIIMSGMSVTLARQYTINFSKPYFRSGLMILVKDLHKYAFIKNVETAFAQSITWRIGVVKGTTGETFTRQKNTGAKAIRAFANQDEALKALIAGHIDVFIHDAPIVLMMAAQHQAEGVRPLPFMINEEFLAWGLRKGDTELAKSVNAFIDQAKQQGTLQTIVKRWIPLAQ
jgi:polar amino acid transport system substrate-binding protein